MMKTQLVNRAHKKAQASPTNKHKLVPQTSTNLSHKQAQASTLKDTCSLDNITAVV